MWQTTTVNPPKSHTPISDELCSFYLSPHLCPRSTGSTTHPEVSLAPCLNYATPHRKLKDLPGSQKLQKLPPLQSLRQDLVGSYSLGSTLHLCPGCIL